MPGTGRYQLPNRTKTAAGFSSDCCDDTLTKTIGHQYKLVTHVSDQTIQRRKRGTLCIWRLCNALYAIKVVKGRYAVNRICSQFRNGWCAKQRLSPHPQDSLMRSALASCLLSNSFNQQISLEMLMSVSNAVLLLSLIRLKIDHLAIPSL